MANSPDRQQMANAIRALSMDAVEAAKSGHPGMPMGMADAATALFADHLKFDASAPDWPDRDRFILSAGHGSMLIYSLLHLTGYADMTIQELRSFRQLGARTAGHPEAGHAAGIETTTGPLGQGIANGVGFAMAERHLAARFGNSLVDHFTYVIAGDGCLMEGVSHEAASMAGHLGLGRLIILFDDNGISIDGSTDLAVSDDTTARFEAYGWQVIAVDGHDMSAVSAAIATAKAEAKKPSLIRCKTVIGFGAPTKAGTSGVHGAPLGGEEISGTRAALGWDHAPFEIPAEIIANWREVGSRGSAARAAWQAHHDGVDTVDFDKTLRGDWDTEIEEAVQQWKKSLAAEPQKIATRVASQKAIEAILPACPAMFGGSADLTGSNNTRVGAHEIFSKDNYAGSYVHYGVREHGMAAVCNGLAAHGGIMPYCATFLTFVGYALGAIRVTALSHFRVIYVMTHDSIGLGEDGPTHQPVEHMASLRAMPNLLTMRPCDAIETAECWEIALQQKDRPSVLALSRQGVPILCDGNKENLSAKGGYVLMKEDAPLQAVLVATGTEVSLAVEAKAALEAKGIGARVVSMPCTELFDEQSAEYREDVLPKGVLKAAIEAAAAYGWERYVGDGPIIAMNSFGASAPANALYTRFGITSEALVEAVEARF